MNKENIQFRQISNQNRKLLRQNEAEQRKNVFGLKNKENLKNPSRISQFGYKIVNANAKQDFQKKPQSKKEIIDIQDKNKFPLEEIRCSEKIIEESQETVKQNNFDWVLCPISLEKYFDWVSQNCIMKDKKTGMIK